MIPKIKTTIRLPLGTKKEMIGAIVSNGYGLRGKSLWVSEAITQLLAINNYPELVDIGNELAGLVAVESIYLTPDLKALLDNALIEVRKLYPTMEGVQSCIIRTSIIQRLLRAG